MGQEVFYMREAKWKWFAIDENGRGYLYTHKVAPYENSQSFTYENGEYDDRDYCNAGLFDLTGIDWRETLIERQTEQNFS